jgi:hypothetical protein
MKYLPSHVNREIILTGPVRPRTIRDRPHVAAMLRARRATCEVAPTAAKRDA